MGTGWFVSSNWLEYGKFKHFYIIKDKNETQNLPPHALFPAQTLDDWQTERLWDNDELAVLSCNDSGQFLVADHFNPSRAKKFAVWLPPKFYWSTGEFKIIDENTLHQAYFINNQSLVLGKSWQKSEKGSVRHVVLYDFSTDTVTSVFLDKGYTLTGFNDVGQICGWKMDHQASHLEGFLWEPEKGMQSLGDFLPTAINNKGQMVGNLKTPATHLNYYLSQPVSALSKINDLKIHQWTPCVWLDGHPLPLHELLDWENLPWTAILSLNGINDKGDIIGHGLLDQQVQAILLKPIPEKNSHTTD